MKYDLEQCPRKGYVAIVHYVHFRTILNGYMNASSLLWFREKETNNPSWMKNNGIQ